MTDIAGLWQSTGIKARGYMSNLGIIPDTFGVQNRLWDPEIPPYEIWCLPTTLANIQDTFVQIGHEICPEEQWTTKLSKEEGGDSTSKWNGFRKVCIIIVRSDNADERHTF